MELNPRSQISGDGNISDELLLVSIDRNFVIKTIRFGITFNKLFVTFNVLNDLSWSKSSGRYDKSLYPTFNVSNLARRGRRTPPLPLLFVVVVSVVVAAVVAAVAIDFDDENCDGDGGGSSIVESLFPYMSRSRSSGNPSSIDWFKTKQNKTKNMWDDQLVK